MSCQPESAGSPLSVNSLSRTLRLDHKTVSRYLSALEDLFIVFQIPAFSRRISRSLVKSKKKIYFHDFGFISPSNPGARLENLVAGALLKHCAFVRETSRCRALELSYLRAKDQRETDFLISKQGAPLMMIEVKPKDAAFDKNLVYFNSRYGIPGKRICPRLRKPRQIRGRQIASEDIESFLLFLDPEKDPAAAFCL